jgi:ribosomal protein S18 acetylase RimI-like enzyme
MQAIEIKGSEPVVREIVPADEACLGRFFSENNVPAVVRQFHPFALTCEKARAITCNPGRDLYYGAFYGNRMVGFTMLRGWDEGYSVPSFGILVDLKFHGRGLGEKLTAFTIGEARRLGCPRVRLTVYASNASALQFYMTQGFVEHTRKAVMIGPDPDEKIVMLKEL